MKKIELTIFSGLEGYIPHSMQKVRDGIITELTGRFSPQVTVNDVRIPVRIRPFYSGAINRYVRYFPYAASRYSAVNHIPDHANAALALYLPGQAKVIITCHDIYPIRYHPRDIIFNRLTLLAYRRANHIVTDSAFTKRELTDFLSLPEHKISVIPPGLDHAVFRVRGRQDCRRLLGIVGKEKIILHVGTDEKRKNVSSLLYNFNVLVRKDSSCRLVKIGAFGLDSLEIIRRLGIGSRIRTFSHLSDADVASWYGAADVLVFPSFYEGFGLPVAEAMACGCPVVAANTASLPEVGGNAALYTDPGKPEELYRAMSAVLTKPMLRTTMIRSGIRQAQRFTWHAAGDRLFQLYSRINEQKP